VSRCNFRRKVSVTTSITLILALCSIMRDYYCHGPERPIVHRYRTSELYDLGNVNGRLRPENSVLDTIHLMDLFHYRGCRAGRRVQHYISTIGNLNKSDKRRNNKINRKINKNNLIVPVIQQHAVQPVSTLLCGTLNIRSARNKILAINDTIIDNKLDLLARSETWHENSDSTVITQLRDLNYNVIEQARPFPIDACIDSVDYINHGGVALVSVLGVQLNKHVISGQFTTFEFVCGRVSHRNNVKHCMVLVIYRPGSVSPNQLFFKQFSDLLDQISVLSMELYITGDINIRLDRAGDSDTLQMVDLLSSHGLVQHVNQPTHNRGGIIDIVVSRVNCLTKNPTVTDIGISDHFLICWSLNASRPDPIYCSVTRRDWKSFQSNNFKHDLNASPLCDSTVIENATITIDEMSMLFSETITSLLNNHSPLKTVSFRKRASNAWFDDD